jgi:hypothetical protein
MTRTEQSTASCSLGRCEYLDGVPSSIVQTEISTFGTQHHWDMKGRETNRSTEQTLPPLALPWDLQPNRLA